ncbi:MAG: DUF4400 domain-containing protein [Salinisphaera sp.]|nr:DUF4400 domain-containing protein [Salinisphaera sp.]
MAGRQDRFSALIWLFIGLVVVELAIVVLFVPSRALVDYNAGARAHVAAELGTATENKITDMASTWYRVSLVRPGFVEALDTFLFGGETGIGSPDYSGYQYVRDRVQTFWNVLFAVYYRLAVIIVWVPYLAPLILAVMIDAIQERRVRQARFSYVSPLMRSLSARSRTVLLSLLIVVLVLPVHMPALAYPFVIGLLLLSSWVTITHLQKHM